MPPPPHPSAMPPFLPLIAALSPRLAARLRAGGDPAALAAAQAAAAEALGVDPADPMAEAAALARLRADPAAARALQARLDALAVPASPPAATTARRGDVMLISAFAAVVGIALVMFLLSLSADAGNSALINTLVGFLSGIGGMFARNIGTAFDYEFGSSRGSAEKTDCLAGLAAHPRRRRRS